VAASRDMWVVSSEFATVTLTLDADRSSGTRLVVRDADSGAEASVGALELEVLARSTFEERVAFYRTVMRMAAPAEANDPKSPAA
jgi:hypothetical protein